MVKSWKRCLYLGFSLSIDLADSSLATCDSYYYSSIFRYFSSSLLLIYDGAECPQSLCGKGMAEVKEEFGGAGGEEKEHEHITKCRTVSEEVNWKSEMSVSALNSTATTPSSIRCAGATPSCATPTSNVEATPISGVAFDATPTCNGSCVVMPTSSHSKLPYACNGTFAPSHLERNPKNIACKGILSPPMEKKPHFDHTTNISASSNNATLITTPTTTPSLMSPAELEEGRRHFDLRMIDFARSTHADCYDHICYTGLDECYLAGLDSLIDVFLKMMDDTSNCQERDIERTN